MVAGNNPESPFSCLTSKVFVKWQRVAGTKTYKQVEKGQGPVPEQGV